MNKEIKILFFILLYGIILFIFPSCQNENQDLRENTINQSLISPLPSWEDGKTKQAIIDFVNAACDENSPDFIPVKDRIACFDNDGTLWSEKPYYFQLFFALARVKAMAADHPEWKTQQPYKSIIEDDLETFLSFGENGVLEVLMTTHAGMSTTDFEAIVKDWLISAEHPRFKRPFTDLVYQPMLELLSYLRQNEFKTFIVSGGGIEFMRPWATNAYGIPSNQIIGSSIKTALIFTDSVPELMRLAKIDFIDDKDGKPIGINKFIGQKPVFSVGNSNGDLEMLQWTASGKGKTFKMLIHHTDSVREWAYDRNSSIGKLSVALDEARRKNWNVVDMKEDWKVIYPFELTE